MTSYYIGIDQSYTSSGIVILDSNQAIIHDERICSSTDDDIFARAWFVADSISATINKFKPKCVGIEGLAFSKFGNATRDLAGLQFTIIHRLRYTHSFAELVIVTPNELKKYATTKGNADKKEMFRCLPKDVSERFEANYKKTKGLFDITDAYWIARYTLEKDIKKNSQTSPTEPSSSSEAK